MSFVIDTDTCSAHLKGHPKVTSRFLQYTGNLHISAVSLGELWTWVLRANASPKRAQGLQLLLNDVVVLELNEDVARRFGEVRADLLDRGQPTPDMDLLIAATALHHGFTVVTHNVVDFANIPNLNVLDWLA
jgi:predicted nucleic acid-binding protein